MLWKNNLVFVKRVIFRILYAGLFDVYHFHRKVSHLLKRHFPHLNFKFVSLTVATSCWAETMVCCLRNMNDEDLDRQAVCLDCHMLPYGVDILAQVRMLPRLLGATFFYKPEEDDAMRGRKSYIRLNDMGEVCSIREKSAISSEKDDVCIVFDHQLRWFLSFLVSISSLLLFRSTGKCRCLRIPHRFGIALCSNPGDRR